MKDRFEGVMPASASKPKLLANITTRVLVTETDGIYEDPDAPGMTIGQLIDRQFDHMANPPHFNGNPPEGWKAPEVYSVTVELPRQD